MDSYLVDQIIEVTKDEKSRAFWARAVRVLGEGVVAEELGELKCQMNTREVRWMIMARLGRAAAPKAHGGKNGGIPNVAW